MTYRICTAGHSAALAHAATLLRQAGCTVISCPDEATTHLILPVPSFEPDGSIKGGGDLQQILSALPSSATVIGGNLHCDLLAGYKTIDLLDEAEYVAENASITAYCAIGLAMEKLPRTLKDAAVLVIGWGRIGKCLARLLKQMGAAVTVAARKESDRAMLKALGFTAIDTKNIDTAAFLAVFNTVPEMVVPRCEGQGLFMDLASRPGLGGEHVITARGLPGRYAPQSSGALIARSVLTILNKECCT